MTPRGIEILVKKASVDGAFRGQLLEERSGAAERIGLELNPAEAAMLDAIPEAQLAATIEKTKVAPLLRPAFMGYAAAAMLAVAGILTYGCDNTPESEKVDNKDDNAEPPRLSDNNDDAIYSMDLELSEGPKVTGIRPDLVEPPEDVQEENSENGK